MSTPNNRFTDPTPFTPLSQLSPEAREWHLKVMAAKAREGRGEPGAVQELIELGVYSPDIVEVRARQAEERATRWAAEAVDAKEDSVELDRATIEEIKLQARNGKTIAQIGKELKVDYWEVWNHAERSWQGTKWIITNRLKLLAKENDQK